MLAPIDSITSLGHPGLSWMMVQGKALGGVDLNDTTLPNRTMIGAYSARTASGTLDELPSCSPSRVLPATEPALQIRSIDDA